METNTDPKRLAALNLAGFRDGERVLFCPTCEFQLLDAGWMKPECLDCRDEIRFVTVDSELRWMCLQREIFSGLETVGDWTEFAILLGRIVARNHNGTSTWEMACSSDQKHIAYGMRNYLRATKEEIDEAKSLVGKPLEEVEDHFLAGRRTEL